MHRRRFLETLGCAAVTTSLAACQCKQMIIPIDRCASLLGPSDLMIDAHCHVFNASDLLVAGFLHDVVARESKHPWSDLLRNFAQDIQDIGWELAPSIADEQQALTQLTQPATALSNQRLAAHLSQPMVQQHQRDAQERYRQGVNRLMSIPGFKARYQSLYQKPTSKQAASSAFTAHPADVTQAITKSVRSQADLETLKANEQASGMSGPVSFLEPFFNYRYLNCKTMFDTFTCNGLKLDLICPAMVDFDGWLEGSAHPKSSIAEQIEVMEQVAKFYGGMVHPYAPFNPRSAITDANYFATVTSAVTERGFIGFKIYPPMGFAPADNVSVKTPPSSWPKNQSDFGAQLDVQLRRLYSFAAQNQTAILTHCSPSNVTSDAVYSLFAPEKWTAMLALVDESGKPYFRSDGARICFGHFGGDYPNLTSQWSTQLGSIVTTNSAAFADLSYYEDVLKCCVEHMKQRLQPAISNPVTASRLLYGSDWDLLGQESGWNTYLARFAGTLPELFPAQGASAVRSIMGDNATLFLGLRKGMNARTRLDSLYSDSWNLPAPAWEAKVNSIKALSA